jgi:periplasmic protein TonB
MEANQILSANLLDILFDGRNKAYGAYELRRDYNKRLGLALALMFAIGSFIMVTVLFADHKSRIYDPIIKVDDKILTSFTKPIEPPPPPPPPSPAEPPTMQVTRMTPPVIVEDNQVRAEEMPPEIDVIHDSRIGTYNQDGIIDLRIVAPPVETKSMSEIVTPREVVFDFEKTFTKVEIPAEFPGGQLEWKRYLQKNLQYPVDAIERGNESIVRVQFVVDTDGNISEVEALNDPGDGLAEEAVRIIKKGPKWKPAEQNGRKVKYRHIQAITFRLG